MDEQMDDKKESLNAHQAAPEGAPGAGERLVGGVDEVEIEIIETGGREGLVYRGQRPVSHALVRGRFME